MASKSIASIHLSRLPIDSVCVFQADRAEVHRVIPIQLLTGQNEITLLQLPNATEPDSIRVEGLGNAAIFDVIYSPPNPQSNGVDSNSPDMKAIYREISDLNAQENVVRGQLSVLNAYSKTVTATTADAKTLAKFMDVYLKSQRQINSELVDISEKRTAAYARQSELLKAAMEDDDSRKRSAKVTVIVHAREECQGELSLRYMVTGAAWQPLYDLRAKISASPKESSSVSLQYRASIAQRTGEDWTDVDLTLSTASPQQGSDIPTLPIFRIGRSRPSPMPIPQMVMMSAPIPMAMDMQKHAVEVEESDDDMGFGLFDGSVGAPPPPPPLAVRVATAIEGATSSTFVIAGKSSVPSDGDDGTSTHKVSIAVIDLTADMEWVSVPKIEPSAFLRCKVKNTSSYILLEGAANVYIDGSFVCKTSLSNVNPQESFSTSLGVDPAIRITYHPQQKRTKTSSGSLLGPKSDISSCTQRITVKNTRSSSVAPLYVKDQVPVSEDDGVKVIVQEPAALGTVNERKEVQVASGIKARWAYKENEDNVEDEGVVVFVCDVAPAESLDLTLSWDILTPAGKGGWVRR